MDDIPRYAVEGWESITDGDRERLKWAGVFFRRQTPGHFMMRLRIPNGFLSATQLRTIGAISGEFGKGFADLTTRQQIQLRWFTINDVPEIWHRLRAVDLISLQTGMDNIRGVIGCPVAGLTTSRFAHVLLPVAQWSEKEGMTNSERRITYMPQLAEPPGEALPDWRIISLFARALGLGTRLVTGRAKKSSLSCRSNRRDEL